MNRLVTYLEAHPRTLYLLCAVLLLPALFLNLGLGAIMADEPTRALVALEMYFSDQYLTPTIYGEYYYKKPPVFNWLILFTAALTGSFSELTIRLPAVVPLLLYGASIFWAVRHFLNWQIGFLAAMMFLTNGRMLIYDSFIGHIDIFYAWLTYLSFVAIMYYWQRQRWLLLFVVSYLLSAVAFLSKGLPTLLFQGISLLVVFTYHRQFKRLFHWQHFVGLGLFLLIVGTYFYAYHQQNSLLAYFETLWTESSQRTVAEKSWLDSVLHLFTFPVEFFGYHILPWSLLVIYVFHRSFWRELWQQDALRLTFLLLAGNVAVYWLAPETYPRYLFMLYPLFFTLLAYAFFHYHARTQPYHRILMQVFGGIMVIGSLGIWAAPFVDVIKTFPLVWVKTASLFLAMALTTWLFYRLPTHRWVLFTLFLLLFRIGFNWFILPHRYETGVISQYKRDGLKIAEITQGAPLYIKNCLFFVGSVLDEETLALRDRCIPFNHDLGYYVTRERKDILRIREAIQPGAYYICSDQQLEGLTYEVHYEFYTRHQHTPLKLVTFSEPPSPDP